jgi:AcrR family transcriptional regulator
VVIDVHDPELADEHVVAERIIRAAIEAYRALPFHDVDARAVAERAGVTPEQVVAAFPAWDALLIVTYDRWVELRGATRREHPTNTLDYVRMTLAEDASDPGLVRILAGAINIAAAGTTFAALFRQRYEEYYTAIAMGLTRDFSNGSIDAVVSPEHAATQLLALYEGLQLQMLVRPHIDVVQQYDVAASTLRSGWSRQEPRAWALDA